MKVRRSTADWEGVVGDQIRSTRIQVGKTMDELARDAGVSIGALRNLERGRGATLRTLVRVVRVLDRTDWLEALATPVAVSPMQELRARRAATPRQRVRTR